MTSYPTSLRHLVRRIPHEPVVELQLTSLLLTPLMRVQRMLRHGLMYVIVGLRDTAQSVRQVNVRHILHTFHHAPLIKRSASTELYPSASSLAIPSSCDMSCLVTAFTTCGGVSTRTFASCSIFHSAKI